MTSRIVLTHHFHKLSSILNQKMKGYNGQNNKGRVSLGPIGMTIAIVEIAGGTDKLECGDRLDT
jgi:hypothetical protein